MLINMCVSILFLSYAKYSIDKWFVFTFNTIEDENRQRCELVNPSKILTLLTKCGDFLATNDFLFSFVDI